MIIFKTKYVLLLLLTLNLIVSLCFSNKASMDKFSIQKEYYKAINIGEIREIKEIDIPVSYPVYDPKDEIEVNSY